MKYLQNTWDLLRSPRFISFYWLSGIGIVVEFLALLNENINKLGLSEFAVVIITAAIAQVTKALMNLKKGKAMGFAPKK